MKKKQRLTFYYAPSALIVRILKMDLITCFPSPHLSIRILVKDCTAYNFDFEVPQRFAASARREKERGTLRRAP